MIENTSPQVFSLGNCIMTPGIQSLIERYAFNPQEFLKRHEACDWHELSQHDRDLNVEAVRTGEQVFSKYTFAPSSNTNIEVYVITDPSEDGAHNTTTILLANEY